MLLSNRALAMMSRTLSHCKDTGLHQPLTGSGWMFVYYEQIISSHYRGEDQTLGPGICHLDLLQGSQHGLHLGGVASLKRKRKRK